MADIWQIYIFSAAGCVVVAITFFATVQPWQPSKSRITLSDDRTIRYELFDWKFWCKEVSIDDAPREGEDDAKKPIFRKLWFPGLLIGLFAGFALAGISNLLFKSMPRLLYTSWVIAFMVGPVVGNFFAYKGLVLRRHFFGWCYVILFNSLLGLENVLNKSYISKLFDDFPDPFLGGPPDKIIMVGVILFCWRAATRGFENWKSDIREVRKEAGMGPIPPEWSPHIAMNDLFSAVFAILIVILFV